MRLWSSSTTWAATTEKTVGQIVRKVTSNGYLYQVVVAGTTGGTEPSWPTVVGTTVVDSGVTWLCIGTSVSIFTAGAAVTWNASGGSLAAAYVLFYDSTPATNATRPVLGYWDLGGTQTATGGNFTVTPNATGGLLSLPTS